MNLPARVDELPPELRRVVAYTDIDRLQTEAETQIAVEAHYAELQPTMRACIREKQPAYINRLYELIAQTGRLSSHAGPAEALETMLAPEVVTRHVLSSLHPDKVADDGSVGLRIFQAITDARAGNDANKEQRFVAAGAALLPYKNELPLGELERRRYIAHVALQDYQARFSSHRQVELWVDERIKLAPFQWPGIALEFLRDSFCNVLRHDDMVLIPPFFERQFWRTLDEINETKKWLLGRWHAPAADIALIDITKVDGSMEYAIDLLEELWRSRQLWLDEAFDDEELDCIWQLLTEMSKIAHHLRTPKRPPKLDYDPNQETLFDASP